MKRDRLTKEAIKTAQLSTEELENLVSQLDSSVFFSSDEKILYLNHFGSMRKYKWHRRRFRRIAKYGEGDLILTSNKLLYGDHPITRVKKGFFSSEKVVHHDEYFEPIALKVDLGGDIKAYMERKYLVVEYCVKGDDYKLRIWGDYDDEVDFQVALEKAIDSYKYVKSRPKLEVVHKGTVVTLNVDSKGFLLNVEPCPTCGANLLLSQDRKTAYCSYCKKEIPTVEQIRET